VLRDITELNAQNQGFVDAFLSSFPGTAEVAEHRASMLRSLAELCRRAQEAGALRTDFVLDDLILVLMAGRGLPVTPPKVRLAAMRRLTALALEAFRASGPAAALPPPARIVPAAFRTG
jgi:hypothetical protein